MLIAVESLLSMIISYGISLAHCRTKEMLRLYCEEAKSYGDVPLPVGLPARQITVVLNPASNGGCCFYIFLNHFVIF